MGMQRTVREGRQRPAARVHEQQLLLDTDPTHGHAA
jgi:hypothetical protein